MVIKAVYPKNLGLRTGTCNKELNKGSTAWMQVFRHMPEVQFFLDRNNHHVLLNYVKMNSFNKTEAAVIRAGYAS